MNPRSDGLIFVGATLAGPRQLIRPPVTGWKTFELSLRQQRASVPKVAGEKAQYAQAVDDTGVKAGAGRFGEISRRHGNLFDPKTQMNRLHQYLLVENKLIEFNKNGTSSKTRRLYAR